MGCAEIAWNGRLIPRGWSLAPGERRKIEDPDLPPGVITPWNVEWGDYPSGFVRCDGSKHGNMLTPDLRAKEDLVVYICKVGF